MWNAGLDEAQAGIKTARRTNNKLRKWRGTKEPLVKVKEESGKASLKLNIQKTKIMASGPITSLKINEQTMETVTDFIFLGCQITADGDYSHEIKRHFSLEEKLWHT